MPIKKRIVKSVKKTNTRVAKKVDAPKMVSLWRAIANFFAKYFQFSGTATRAEYWWSVLFLIVSVVCLFELAFRLHPLNLFWSGLFAFLGLAFVAIVFVPMWSVQARRLHDAGFSAKLLWISLIFFVYSMLVPRFLPMIRVVDWISMAWSIFILVLMILPSKVEKNPYRD